MKIKGGQVWTKDGKVREVLDVDSKGWSESTFHTFVFWRRPGRDSGSWCCLCRFKAWAQDAEMQQPKQ